MNNSGINYITLFESVLIAGIIIYQAYEAWRIRLKIKDFSNLIPEKKFFSVEEHLVSKEDIAHREPKNILKNLSYGSLITTEQENDNIHTTSVDKVTVSLINPTKESNTIFKDILYDINSYLLKSRSTTTNFNHIKEITERHLETEDEAIQQTLSIPLYLGLMGTILGIIFGLANLFFISNSESDFGIQGFLVGVAIAMGASLFGLAVTVYNSNYVYKKARIKFDKAKNQFYNFIQISLLSKEDHKVSADVITIHNSITDFNDNFSRNIQNLGGILLKNYDAVIAQDAILAKLEKVDIYKFAEANAIIFKELKKGATEFQQFNSNINALNTSIQGTTELSESFTRLLSKTNNFESFAEKLNQGVIKSNELGQFLENHFTVIEQRGEILDEAVKDYDDMLVKSLETLRNHTKESISSIQQITDKEEDLLAKSFEKYSSELSNLSLLKDLTEKSEELKTTFSIELEKNEKVLGAILEELKKAREHKNSDNTESLTNSFAKQAEDLRIELSNKLERSERVLEAILEELKTNSKRIGNTKNDSFRKHSSQEKDESNNSSYRKIQNSVEENENIVDVLKNLFGTIKNRRK